MDGGGKDYYNRSRTNFPHHPNMYNQQHNSVPPDNLQANPPFHNMSGITSNKNMYQPHNMGAPPAVNEAPRFDSSDFPALGEAPKNAMSSSNSLSFASTSQAQSPQDFALQNEDFPALGAANPPNTSRHWSGAHQIMHNQPPPSQQQQQQQQQHHLSDGADVVSQQRRMVGPGMVGAVGKPPHLQQQQQQQKQQQQGVPPMQRGNFQQSSTPIIAPPSVSPPVAGAGQSDANNQDKNKNIANSNYYNDKWGLNGLLGIIRMTDPDLNTLALGTDLTTLGLNLNSSEVLYAAFAYPCIDKPTRSEHDYALPYCYYMQPPALKTSHLTKFELETLFYIFYSMPKDTLQVYAAKELYNRQWRYHKKHKLWTTTIPKGKDADGNPLPPNANDKDSNQPQLIYFDIYAWRKRRLRDLSLLESPSNFMTEEELASL